MNIERLKELHSIGYHCISADSKHEAFNALPELIEAYEQSEAKCKELEAELIRRSGYGLVWQDK